MSEKPSPADLRATHSLLSTLRAEHRGWLAHDELLSRLVGEAPRDLPRLREGLEAIEAWTERLFRLDPLIGAGGQARTPAELERALELLDGVTVRLEVLGRGLGSELDALREHVHDGTACAAAAPVLAALTWRAYALDHEVRGTLYFGERLGDAELEAMAAGQAELAREGLAVVHHLLERLEATGAGSCSELAELHRSARHLPGLYRAQVEGLRGLAGEIRGLRGA